MDREGGQKNGGGGGVTLGDMGRRLNKERGGWKREKERDY